MYSNALHGKFTFLSEIQIIILNVWHRIRDNRGEWITKYGRWFAARVAIKLGGRTYMTSKVSYFLFLLK